MFAGLVVALSFLVTLVFLLHFYFDYRAERGKLEISEIQSIRLASQALQAETAAVNSDLMFLGRMLGELDYTMATLPGRMQFISSLFKAFAAEKGIYDQVRFLDTGGRERVRINLTADGVEQVRADELQNKSSRYYVSRALRLAPGQVYLSPLDLNVEQGRVEMPPKPVLRFATPVFDAQGTLRGLVVLNYLGEHLLEHFRRSATGIRERVQLLNRDGYWLSSPRPGEAWGFMLGHGAKFQERYPQVWSRIAAGQNGQFLTEQGLFTFATVRPAERMVAPRLAASPDGWKVVSVLALDLGARGMGSFIRRHAGLYLGVFGLLLILVYLLASAETRRREAEERRAHEMRFRRTLEDIALAAVMVDLNGHLVYCNRHLLGMAGWRHAEVIGSDWIERFVPVDQRHDIRTVLARVQESGVLPAEFEGELCTREGDRRLVAWKNTLTLDADGAVIGLTAIGEDITERRRAEEEVRKLSRAVEQSPAVVLITDASGQIEYVNPKFTALTGYSLEEVVGENPRILRSGETSAEEYGRLWRALMAGGEWRGEFHNRRKDGSLYWESAVISAVRDGDGVITHFLAVKEDITERKRLEQEVAARNRDLAHAQALAEMGQMATMLAHDLRNPLSSVKMAVQILGRGALTDETRELAAIGEEQVRYMEDIITDMLAYAKPGELQMAWLEPCELLQGVEGTVRRQLAEYGVTLVLECPTGLPAVPGDAPKLRQLLSNLVLNAIQATDGRPTGEREVVISVEQIASSAGRGMRFCVADNGSGIDAGVADRVFDPFFTTRTKGTGLGLAIVRQIADQHGAEVEIVANEPRGTRVVLTLLLTPQVQARMDGIRD